MIGKLRIEIRIKSFRNSSKHQTWNIKTKESNNHVQNQTYKINEYRIRMKLLMK